MQAELLFKILEAGLSLLDHHLKTKYAVQLLELKEEYYEEYSKDPEIRDDARLDRILMRIQLLCDSALAASGNANNSNMQKP